MVELTGYIDIPDIILDEVVIALKEHIILTQQEDGCLKFSVTQDSELKTRFHIFEQFDSQQSFEFHQSRVQFSDWGALTKTAQRCYQIRERQ